MREDSSVLKMCLEVLPKCLNGSRLCHTGTIDLQLAAVLFQADVGLHYNKNVIKD
jgi:hypothetical protein